MANGEFGGSGVTDNHAIWAGLGLLAGFIFKANGWAEKDAEGKILLHWKAFFADLTSAAMIWLMALAVAALWPVFGLGPQPPALTAGTVVILVLVGLRPLTEKIYALFDALIVRVKGGAS